MIDNDRKKVEQSLELSQLPESPRTLMLDDSFMISDNIGSDRGDVSSVLETLHSGGHPAGVPFKIHFNMMLVCLQGSLRVRVQMRECVIGGGDMIVMIAGGIGEYIEMSDDARLMMMAFTDSFEILDSGEKPTPELMAGIARHPVISLDSDELDAITAIYRMLCSRLSDSGFRARRELARCCMRTAFCYISDRFVAAGAGYKLAYNRQQQILDSFMQLLDEYGKSQRNLAFYAGRLCITPKYLSKVVREVSGRSAREWICSRVLLEAKVMLKESRLSVQQISDALNFPNQSFFGAFFRRGTGMSPGRYRSQG